MSTQVVPLRADSLEIAAWKALAASLGLPFNRWARRALNDQLELDVALLRERESESEGSRDGRNG